MSTSSRIVSSTPANLPIENAEQPVVSPDGRWLAFAREDHGRLMLWLHALDGSRIDAPLTGPNLDVLEATFAPNGDIVFAALNAEGIAKLFERNATGETIQLPTTGEARYPAVSPDGKWLAYSELVHGSWNLRLLDRNNGHTEVLTSTPCNAVESAWEPDSHTLLFATDCGRAIGQTALYRRQVIP